MKRVVYWFAIALSVLGILVAVGNGPFPNILIGVVSGFALGAFAGHEYQKYTRRRGENCG